MKPCLDFKGSESKPMVCKLKSQFEELRSKVLFLDCVKKYLEVPTSSASVLSQWCLPGWSL